MITEELKNVKIKDYSGQYYQDTDEKDFEIRTIREERLIDPAPVWTTKSNLPNRCIITEKRTICRTATKPWNANRIGIAFIKANEKNFGRKTS